MKKKNLFMSWITIPENQARICRIAAVIAGIWFVARVIGTAVYHF
jgi:hypothetical protein